MGRESSYVTKKLNLPPLGSRYISRLGVFFVQAGVGMVSPRFGIGCGSKPIRLSCIVRPEKSVRAVEWYSTALKKPFYS